MTTTSRPTGSYAHRAMAINRSHRFVEWVSELVGAHRLKTFVVGSALIVFLAGGAVWAVTYDGGLNVATWVALALMAYAVIATTVLLPRTVPRQTRSAVALGMAFSPVCFGIAVSLYGAPLALIWVGAAASVGLLGFLTRTAEMSGVDRGLPPGDSE